MIDGGQYVWPVLELETKGQSPTVKRYCGCSFFISEERLLVTCRHVLEDNASPYVQDRNGFSHRIFDISCHATLDLAVARVQGIEPGILTPLTCRLTLGGDLCAFAYLDDHMEGTAALLPTIAKGYITTTPRTNQQCEGGFGKYAVSFPSLAGFSGAPVTMFDQPYFAGMLFGNLESEITVFSNSEVNDDGSVWREQLVRVIDQGQMIGYGEITRFVEACQRQAG